MDLVIWFYLFLEEVTPKESPVNIIMQSCFCLTWGILFFLLFVNRYFKSNVRVSAGILRSGSLKLRVILFSVQDILMAECQLLSDTSKYRNSSILLTGTKSSPVFCLGHYLTVECLLLCDTSIYRNSSLWLTGTKSSSVFCSGHHLTAEF